MGGLSKIPFFFPRANLGGEEGFKHHSYFPRLWRGFGGIKGQTKKRPGELLGKGLKREGFPPGKNYLYRENFYKEIGLGGLNPKVQGLVLKFFSKKKGVYIFLQCFGVYRIGRDISL